MSERIILKKDIVPKGTMSKEILLKKDIIIPKGTVFSDCAGEVSHYYSGMYKATIALDKDTSAEIAVNDENKECFEEVKISGRTARGA